MGILGPDATGGVAIAALFFALADTFVKNSLDGNDTSEKLVVGEVRLRQTLPHILGPQWESTVQAVHAKPPLTHPRLTSDELKANMRKVWRKREENSVLEGDQPVVKSLLPVTRYPAALSHSRKLTDVVIGVAPTSKTLSLSSYDRKALNNTFHDPRDEHIVLPP